MSEVLLTPTCEIRQKQQTDSVYECVNVSALQTTRSLTVTVKLQLDATHLAAWWGHHSVLHMLIRKICTNQPFKVWFAGVKAV